MYSLDQIHLDRWTWTSPSEYQMDQNRVFLGPGNPWTSHLEVIFMLKYAVKIHYLNYKALSESGSKIPGPKYLVGLMQFP